MTVAVVLPFSVVVVVAHQQVSSAKTWTEEVQHCTAVVHLMMEVGLRL